MSEEETAPWGPWRDDCPVTDRVALLAELRMAVVVLAEGYLSADHVRPILRALSRALDNPEDRNALAEAKAAVNVLPEGCYQRVAMALRAAHRSGAAAVA